MVSFEHTIYEVAETAGQVEVCVVLTNPDIETIIHSPEVVGVEVYEDPSMKTNEHFPSDAAIASEFQ